MMNDEDAIFLFQAKLEIEKRFEEELWERIAVKVKELGGTLYTVSLRERNYMVFGTLNYSPSLMRYVVIINV